ncbi:MAG: SPOR domain-containing protein [Hyphomonadaceae bacterium]|nr:SPOR domain-containing protein [Hyphomonadaceae bacterium]
MSRSYDPRMHAQEAQSRHAGMVYVLMLVVALAFGGFVWQLYSEPTGPRVTSPAVPNRPVAAPTVPLNPPGPPVAISEPEAQSSTVSSASDAVSPPTLAPATDLPHIVNDGPFVAQLAALQSEPGVNVAWQRIAARAPDLFSAARLDVERADLGQRGVYYRVRAGYFADRESAAAFCERVRRMGHDCIVATR